jgi:hypothetical protein
LLIYKGMLFHAILGNIVSLTSRNGRALNLFLVIGGPGGGRGVWPRRSVWFCFVPRFPLPQKPLLLAKRSLLRSSRSWWSAGGQRRSFRAACMMDAASARGRAAFWALPRSGQRAAGSLSPHHGSPPRVPATGPLRQPPDPALPRTHQRSCKGLPAAGVGRAGFSTETNPPPAKRWPTISHPQKRKPEGL